MKVVGPFPYPPFMPDYHLPGRYTPDNRDDYEDDDPGVITTQRGRLGINKYGDGDADDAEADYTSIHNRRNVTPLPTQTPDPYSHRSGRS